MQMTNVEWNALSQVTRDLIGLDLHRCHDVAEWCSDEETTFLSIMGERTVEDVNARLRREVMPEDLVAVSVETKRGHWIGPEDEADNFGLKWRPDEDGCLWTHAVCEWQG